jgi:hypothetical protein
MPGKLSRKLVKAKKTELFHISAPAGHKIQLVSGKKFVAGEAHNPFFGFYEQPRTYDVARQGGGFDRYTAIAFLRAVRDGGIQDCTGLAVFACEIAQHYQMLARELLMEQVRDADYPRLPSRQSCLWACNTIEEARLWQGKLGTGSTICRLEVTGTVHRADSKLLLADSEPLSRTIERAHAYWRGEVSDNPEMETLVAGDISVVEIGLG